MSFSLNSSSRSNNVRESSLSNAPGGAPSSHPFGSPQVQPSPRPFPLLRQKSLVVADTSNKSRKESFLQTTRPYVFSFDFIYLYFMNWFL